MSELASFNYTHDKSSELLKFILFNHYARRSHNYSDQDVVLLAEEPFKDAIDFGKRMTIALAMRHPSGFFRACVKNGALKQYFPELFACIDCKQNPDFHHLDVFDHTMLALDNTHELGITDFDTKLAILFHDIGKPPTRKEVPIEV